MAPFTTEETLHEYLRRYLDRISKSKARGLVEQKDVPERDTVTGFPTQPEKFARDLVARLSQLLADPARCRQFGAAGRKRVEEIFSWRSIAGQTVELYRFLIEKSKEQSHS